jgi:hypothetical protein
MNVMKRMDYRVPIVGYWITIQDNIPDNQWAALWADWCWKTSSSIRLVDIPSGLIEREFHPAESRRK